MRVYLARPFCALDVDASADVAGLRAEVGRRSGLPVASLRLLHRGRSLADPLRLSAAGVGEGDLIHALPRLRGGGGDGGVYPPTAHELKWMSDIGGGSKRSSWAVLGGSVSRTQFERVPAAVVRFESCSTCALTGEPLRAPVVCCELGMLYNKATLIEALLAKASRPLDARFAHVRSLKDLTAVALHADTDASTQRAQHEPATEAHGCADTKAPFQCPVTKTPFNGGHPFYAVRPSGQVVSERALAMTGWAVCPVTERPLAPPAAPAPAEAAEEALAPKKRLSADLIPLGLYGEELEAARRRLEERHSRGKQRRGAKQAPPAPDANGADGGADGGGKRPRVVGAAGGGAGPSAQQASVSGGAARGGPPAPAARGAGGGGGVGSLSASRTIQAAQEEIARKARSDVFNGLFLPQARKDEEARQIREGKDYMTRAIQPGKAKER